MEEIMESLEKKKRAAEEEEAKRKAQADESSKNGLQAASASTSGGQQFAQAQSWTFSFLSNMFVMVGLAAFAFIVKHVFTTMS